jgi:hypothetical protein
MPNFTYWFEKRFLKRKIPLPKGKVIYKSEFEFDTHLEMILPIISGSDPGLPFAKV